MAYQPTTYEQALHAWLVVVVGADVTEDRYANADATAPTEPLQTPEVKVTDEDRGDGTYTVRITEHLGGTARVEAYGDSYRELIERIERSLNDPYVLDHNTQHGVEILGPLGPVEDLSEPGSAYRCRLEVRFAHVTQHDSPHGMRALETVEATGTVDDLNVTIVEDDT